MLSLTDSSTGAVVSVGVDTVSFAFLKQPFIAVITISALKNKLNAFVSDFIFVSLYFFSFYFNDKQAKSQILVYYSIFALSSICFIIVL